MVGNPTGADVLAEIPSMKLTPWYLVAIAPIAVAGCSGAFMGQCAVLAVTLCIFVGTLTLGRHASSASSAVAVDPSHVDRS
jgi:hypothetical protein